MPRLLDVLLFFVKTGCLSIGGGYAAIQMIQIQLVDLWKIMSMEEFGTLLVIAETTPGPLTVNAATFVGYRLAGIPGGILCTLCYLFPTVLICIGLSCLYKRVQGQNAVERVLACLRPAVVALTASTAVGQLQESLFGSGTGVSDFSFLSFILLLLAFFLLKWKKLPPWSVILGCGIVGTCLSLVLDKFAV